MRASLPADDFVDLLDWMERVRHVDRDVARDLVESGRITSAHVDYFRGARYGESFAEFRARRSVR